MKSPDSFRLWGGALCLSATVLLQTAARTFSWFGEWYATSIYPAIISTLGRFSGLFPFSVAELLLYLFILWCIAGLIRTFLHRQTWRRLLASGFFAAALLAFLYTANCGVNYYRTPFSHYLGLTVRESSTEELTRLCRYLTDKVNETARKPMSSSAIIHLAQEGPKAMIRLAETYPELSGYYPQAKGLFLPRLLSVQQLSGIYSPFTAEANFNSEMTRYNVPHTICHELSHLRGFMLEDEANFIGYLACIGWDLPEFQYSGYLTGWIYAGNALAKQDFPAYQELYSQLDESVQKDLAENTLFWNRFDGKAAEAASQINDTYLKLNDQKEGVKSYGKMVDLMLAYYRKMQTNIAGA